MAIWATARGPRLLGAPKLPISFLRSFFYSLTCKKFACGAEIHSKICRCGIDIINKILPAATKFKKISLWRFNSKKYACGTNFIIFCTFFACVVKFPMAIIQLYCSSSIFGGAPRTDCQGPPRTLIRPCTHPNSRFLHSNHLVFEPKKY
jgi:hypothetical protein